jgi:hypothetical protein
VNDSARRAGAALRKARLSGKLSACFFLLTALLVLDGLQALMRDDFNRIDLPLGGRTLMSGAMPLQAKAHADIIVDIEGLDGLDFTPLTDFKGFWFGAHMWRATLDASKVAEAGRAVLTVVDLVPAKSTTGNATIMVQNPNQIYVITVWPSAEAMQAAHYSLSRRLTGLSAFIWAGLSLACGAAVGILHYFISKATYRALAIEGIFVIYSVRKTDAGHQAIFSPDGREDLRVQRPVTLFTPEGVEQGAGVLHECSPHKGSALFPPDAAPPVYGWLLRYGAEANAPELKTELPA